MKTNICWLIVALSTSPLMLGGCGEEIKKGVPSSNEYRRMLEERVRSVNGARINIQQQVNMYEKASEDEKRKMFDNAKRLCEE